jgi:hypothetical protein
MPATSQQQQKLMGIVHALQKGDIKPSSVSKKAQKMAKDMKPGEVTKFASTKHKGLPKKVKKEGIEGALDTVYAVQKPYVGCQLTSLIKPIDPLVGLGGSEIVPEKVHAVYADQEMAQKAAQGLFEEFETQQTALEEKKSQVIEKIKKTMDELEKQRKGAVDMIKENPKDAHTHKEKVAKIATKIDDLVDKLQKIEMSKKAVDKDKKEEKTEKKKEDIKETLKKALK